MELRRARPGDEMEVARVHVSSWQVAYRGLIPQEYLDGLRPEDRAGRYAFGKERPATLLALEDGRVLGFATFGPARSEDCEEMGELYALYADPSAWDRGVGRALIAEARASLVGDGYVEAILWVLTGNERAERFYRRDGWAADGCRRMVEAHGITLDESRYRRVLSG
jgi:GNAT superfamily N-acetyltransferase